MPQWQKMIAAATPPASRSAALLRRLGRQRIALAAGAAVAPTLLLGWTGTGPPVPGAARIASLAGSAQLAALSLALGTGLLAYHLARLTLPRADAGGIPGAALLALAFVPGLCVDALLVPMVLTLAGLRTASGKQVVALLVQCGALLLLSAFAVNHVNAWIGSVAMTGFALFSIAWHKPGAANDNPALIRNSPDSRLRATACYDKADSHSGSGEYVSVQ